jgi:hypothetical protein
MLWNKLPDRTAERLLARLYKQPKKLSDVVINTVRPSFYRRAEIVQLFEDRGMALIVAVGEADLAERELFFIGTPVDIRAANDAAGLAITAENALDYLKFFCAVLKVQGVGFHLIESLEGMRLGSCSHVPMDLAMQVTELPDGTYVLKGYMEHGMMLLTVEFQLLADGTVEVLNEEDVGELSDDWL